MKKLLGGWAVFMFLLVIMAGSASAAGVPMFQLPSGMIENILVTLKGPIIALMSIFSVIIALRIATFMMAPSEAELAYAEYEEEYEEYAEKMERKAAFRERFENEHWNDDF